MTFVLIFSSVLANLIASNALCLFLILNYVRKNRRAELHSKGAVLPFFAIHFHSKKQKFLQK